MNRPAWIFLGVFLAVTALSGCADAPPTEQLVRQAVGDFQVGRIDRAKVTLRRALGQSPSDPAALFYMGRICHAEKYYEQAIYYYQCCLDADPGFAVARKHLTEARKNAGPSGEALLFIPEPSEY